MKVWSLVILAKCSFNLYGLHLLRLLEIHWCPLEPLEQHTAALIDRCARFNCRAAAYLHVHANGLFLSLSGYGYYPHFIGHLRLCVHVHWICRGGLVYNRILSHFNSLCNGQNKYMWHSCIHKSILALVLVTSTMDLWLSNGLFLERCLAITC